jgi:hypothetical protein
MFFKTIFYTQPVFTFWALCAYWGTYGSRHLISCWAVAEGTVTLKPWDMFLHNSASGSVGRTWWKVQANPTINHRPAHGLNEPCSTWHRARTFCLQTTISYWALRYTYLSKNFTSLVFHPRRSLRPLACWDFGVESHRGHGYLSVVSFVR